MTAEHRHCPPPVSLLLRIANAVGVRFDLRAVDDALDDLARRLFGAPDADALHELLWDDPGFAVDATSAEGLILPRVLERRAGHPLLLAAVAAEAGRRAGLPAGVWSSRSAWFAGLRGAEGVELVKTSHEGGRPQRVRCHCPHEIAFAALLGLEARQADGGLGQRLRALRASLPVGDAAAAGDGSPRTFWS